MAVRLLLLHGADANARSSDQDTPLHAAAKSGTEDTVRAMLEHGGGKRVGMQGLALGIHSFQALHARVLMRCISGYVIVLYTMYVDVVVLYYYVCGCSSIVLYIWICDSIVYYVCGCIARPQVCNQFPECLAHCVMYKAPVVFTGMCVCVCVYVCVCVSQSPLSSLPLSPLYHLLHLQLLLSLSRSLDRSLPLPLTPPPNAPSPP